MLNVPTLQKLTSYINAFFTKAVHLLGVPLKLTGQGRASQRSAPLSSTLEKLEWEVCLVVHHVSEH